jgi:hypothetical protein
MSAPGRIFRLARMSPQILGLTCIVLALPLVFLVLAAFGTRALAGPALLLMALYLWVWLRFRPMLFVVDEAAVDVVWPLKRRRLERAGIASARPIDVPELRQEIGFCLRVGVGGLWGGFGWLWTRKRGIVQMYVSRTDGLVWIERPGARPWLITPERPDAFVRALSPQATAVPSASRRS